GLNGLLCDATIRGAIELAELERYLVLEYVHSAGCMVTGIRKLEPAHSLTWSIDGSVPRTRCYWKPELGTEESAAAETRRSVEEHCEELRAVVRESVRMELISDVPLGVFLSGGIDSGVVAATM